MSTMLEELSKLREITERLLEATTQEIERTANRRDIACNLIESLVTALYDGGKIGKADVARYTHVVLELRN